MWVRIFALAACYCVVGRVCLLMAIPPRYATAFWPAAGIAVGAILLWGNRVWPGVVLGSFLANVTTAFDATSPTTVLVSLVVPMSIGVGATLQAVVGANLVRRLVGFPDPLNHELTVAKVLFLTGPGSCWIGATCGILSLWIMNRITAGEISFNWWTWWAGDSIGVFVVTPLMLLWAVPRKAKPPRRAVALAAPIGILAVLIVGLFIYTESREKMRLRNVFQFQTEILARALDNHIDYVLQGLYRAQSFHGGAPNAADEQRFAKMARNLLDHRPSVHALSWAPRVSAAQRQDLERTGKFVIQELRNGKLAPASVRPEYFPILYREPGGTSVVGFDVACERDRLEALQRAGVTGEPVASTPVPPLKDSEKRNILVFLPIYRDNVIPVDSSDRPQALRGYVIAVLRVDQLVDIAWQGFQSDGIDFWLFDETADAESRLAYHRSADSARSDAPGSDATTETEPARDIDRSTEMEVAGRRWRLRFAATPAFLAAHRSMQAWMILAGGMLCTGLLGAVLLVATGRAELVAGLVEERTCELAAANAAMKREIAERKRAEDELRSRDESLRQSEDRFRLLVEGTTDYAIFMLDPQGQIVSWNAGAARMHGYRADEIVGRHLSCFFAEEDVRQGKPVSELGTALRAGRFEDEGWRFRKDGSRFWVHVVLTPILDANGHLGGYWKIVRDLTERKQTEEMFRGLLESAPDSIVIVHENGAIALVNRQAELLFGYSRAELLGQSIEKLLPERFQKQHGHYRQSYFANPTARPMGATLSLYGVRKDGTEFPVEISLSPLATDRGILVSSTIRDITERKNAEEALHEARRFVQRIAEMTPSILYVYDVEAQSNIFVNQRLETFLGYAWEDQRPTMPTLLADIHPEDLPRAELANEQCMAAEDDAVIETDLRIRHANGEWRWLNCRSTVFNRDRDGSPTQILGTAQDITDRKRLEQEILEIAATEQRRIGQELHDGTGQELTGLCMLADNLAEALREVEPAEALTGERIARGLRQALGQVRLLSRGLIPVEVDAEGLMAALTELVKRISELHGVQCVFEYAEPVLVEDNHIATQLYRIAQEAITNALKHGRATNIAVTLQTHGRYITLKIADDGVGLPSEQTKEGMGLRIMRYRAGQIGAHFSVRPGATGGTVVACTLYGGACHD